MDEGKSPKVSGFTDRDVEEWKRLDALLSSAPRWNVSSGEAVQLYRSLVWFAGLRGRIESNIFEITKVTNAKEGE